MSDLLLTLLLVALCIGVVTLFLIVNRVGIVINRLQRIDEALRADSENASRAPKPESTAARAGDFEKFLTAHPDLLREPKSAQFAAYRKWRKAQGLNWDKSGSV